ncbi:hypothetical protein D3C85_1452960 [compost metagenome]
MRLAPSPPRLMLPSSSPLTFCTVSLAGSLTGSTSKLTLPLQLPRSVPVVAVSRISTVTASGTLPLKCSLGTNTRSLSAAGSFTVRVETGWPFLSRKWPYWGSTVTTTRATVSRPPSATVGLMSASLTERSR